MKNIIIILVTFLLAIVGIICSVFSPTFARARDSGPFGWSSLPWQHKDDRPESPYSMAELERLKMPSSRPTVNIFVMDCSSSPDDEIQEWPSWLSKAGQILESKKYPVPMTIEGLSSGPSTTSRVVVRAALFSLMHASLEVSTQGHITKETDDKFAVWTLCREATKHFPGGLLDNLGDENIREAMKEIDDLVMDSGADSTTEFLDLFGDLIASYDLDQEGGIHSDNKVIITMISDFEDSPEVRKPGRRQALEAAMVRLIDSGVQTNLVTIGANAQSSDIVTYLESNSDLFTVNRIDILDDVVRFGRSLFIPTYRIDSPLRVYYQDREYGASFASMRMNRASAVEFFLPLLEREKKNTLKVFCEVHLMPDEGGRFGDIERVGEISSGRPRIFDSARKNDVIDIRFEGALPDKAQLLRIEISEAGEAYLIPLIFVPKLPSGFCWMIIFFQAVVIGSFLFLLIAIFGRAVKLKFPVQLRVPKFIELVQGGASANIKIDGDKASSK